MRWQLGRRSTNVIDRRAQGPSRGRGLGGVAGLGGCGTVVVLGIAVLVWALGGDPGQILGGGEPPSGGPVQPASPEESQQADFVSAVLASTEDTWGEIFAEHGATYQPPRLVLFRDGVDSACGYGTTAVGPFYCPNDQMVYLDLSFFDELERRFGAPGDFARAYVIGHEIGHHVQTLTGVTDRVRSQGGHSQNELSVRQELQADCYAGVWASRAERERDLLEEGDIEEGLRAASAIGDDTLQRRSGGHVVPETFTHGSSAQRVEWFRRGFDSGRIESCDTFAVASL